MVLARTLTPEALARKKRIGEMDRENGSGKRIGKTDRENGSVERTVSPLLFARKAAD
jgi:hypothetical protein